MDNKGFDVTDLLKGIAKPAPQPEQLQLLPYASLIPDANNGYSMDGIEELARNIEITGLLQPLRVRPVPNTADAWRIVAGHRRHAAIGLLIKRGSKRFAAGVPCIIDRSEASPALQALQLLLANADNRKMTPADEAQQVERISDCIRRLEDEGYQFSGRHRDWVSKLSGMSRTKIARLQAIGNNLIPELLGPWNEGKIPETTAYELQKLGLPYQLEAFKRMNKRGGFDAAPADRVAWCVQYEAEYAKADTCPDGETCNQHTRRVSATLSTEWGWARCTGGCCLKCGALNSCKFPCAKARAKLAAKEEKEKRDKEARADRAKKDDEKNQEAARKKLQKMAQRLVPLITAAGLKKTDRLPVDYSYMDVKEILDYAAGVFPNRVYSIDLLPSYVYRLKEQADKLHCSVDFLLGLTEDPTPAADRAAPQPATVSTLDVPPEFQQGTPPRSGLYWCSFTYSKIPAAMKYDKDKNVWRYKGAGGELAFDGVQGWWPLPEG